MLYFKSFQIIMLSTITIIFTVLTMAVRISTDSLLIEKCGCLFKSKLSADCSNRENIDFKCLSESKPEEISFKSNNYTEVPWEMFEHEFNETRHIDFSENSIEHIPKNFSHHFVGCQSANFSYNNLTDLSEVQLIDSKVKLSILGNHFQCDCDDPNNIQYNNHAKVCIYLSIINVNVQKLYLIFIGTRRYYYLLFICLQR